MSDLNKIVDELSKLTVLEASELVKMLEEKWGVSAAAPVAVAAAPAAGPVAEEKDSFDVVLVSAGEKKTEVFKIVKNVTGLGLIEAKGLVDNAPKAIKEAVSKEEANKIKAEIEAAGGKVELK